MPDYITCIEFGVFAGFGGYIVLSLLGYGIRSALSLFK